MESVETVVSERIDGLGTVVLLSSQFDVSCAYLQKIGGRVASSRDFIYARTQTDLDHPFNSNLCSTREYIVRSEPSRLFVVKPEELVSQHYQRIARCFSKNQPQPIKLNEFRALLKIVTEDKNKDIYSARAIEVTSSQGEILLDNLSEDPRSSFLFLDQASLYAEHLRQIGIHKFPIFSNRSISELVVWPVVHFPVNYVNMTKKYRSGDDDLSVVGLLE